MSEHTHSNVNSTTSHSVSSIELCCPFRSSGTISPLHCTIVHQDEDDNNLTVDSLSLTTPHPVPSSIAKTSHEIHTVLSTFRQLCMSSRKGAPPISSKVVASLSEVTFNHWAWDEAHLLFFVRAFFLHFTPSQAMRRSRNLRGAEEMNIDERHLPASYVSALEAWLEVVWRHYNKVPFHNFEHAFAVTHMMFAVLRVLERHCGTAVEDEQEHKGRLPCWVQWALLVASLSHDLDHPGFNNTFQVNAQTVLQARYGAESTLERHHANFADKLLHLAECGGFLDSVPEQYRSTALHLIHSTILSTDMAKHSEIVSHFRRLFLPNETTTSGQCPTSILWNGEKRELLCQCLLKACDISNEARPSVVSEVWLERLLSEFFAQSDHEKVVGLPVAPFMDRDKVTKWDSQIGFCKFVILPLFEALASYLEPLEEILVTPVKRQLLHYTEMGQQQKQQQTPARASPLHTEMKSNNTPSRKSSAGSMIDSTSPEISAL